MAEGEKRKIPSWFQPASLSTQPLSPESDAADHLAIEVVDEEKIERFWKLIRNIVADRELSHLNGRKKQRRETELWKPTFEWEDFAAERHGGSSVVKNGGDGRKRSRKEGDEKGEEESSVDLNLGL